MLSGPNGRNDVGWRGLLLNNCDPEEEVKGCLEQDLFMKVVRLKYTIAP